MFDSKVSDWNIVARTPYKKDPLKMLADECHRQGIKLFFYYSQLDWHNPDYYPRGATDWPNGRPDHGDFNAYLDTYMKGNYQECSDHKELASETSSGWLARLISRNLAHPPGHMARHAPIACYGLF